MTRLRAAPRPFTALRFALREMRGGPAGFGIFLACLALGVAAIVGVNSAGHSIERGIAADGQKILGGDVMLSLVQQELGNDTLEYLRGRATISRQVTLRAMARDPAGGNQTLVELKAVDSSYPLYGELTGQNGQIDMAQASSDTAWVGSALLERLNLIPGDRIAMGNHVFTIADTIEHEPDLLSSGFAFGPRVLISLAGLDQAGLVRPGSLYRDNYLLKLPAGESPQGLLTDLRVRFPGSAWRERTRDNAAPALARNVEQITQFLTLVGLAGLVLGGVGIANSIQAYMAGKRRTIATLKTLGAGAGLVLRIYLIEVMILAAVGSVIGILIGAALPRAAAWLLAGIIPFASPALLDGRALLLGLAYGGLITFIFALWPIAVARDIPAAHLFRSASGPAHEHKPPRPQYLATILAGVIMLVGLAMATAADNRLTLIFLAGLAGAFLALRAAAMLTMTIARRLTNVPGVALRIAIGNIHRPGALTPSIVLSLGLGLSLIAALAMIDFSLRRQISVNIPREAPDFFFLDIQSDEYPRFADMIGQLAPAGTLQAVPMLRGRITHIRSIAAEDYTQAEGSWVLRGDRGITYSTHMPENSNLAQGDWWPPDYEGEPLVSFSAEEAGELGLSVGDTITVNVLGRSFDARIANLRNVEWESLRINFVMVFSPNSLAGAPHGWLATLSLPDNAPQNAGEIERTLASSFPTVTSLRVSDALQSVEDLLRQLATAIRAISSLALVTGGLALAGSLAAGNRKRLQDSVILKALGATRKRVLAAFVLEFALLAIICALFALLAGGAAAWFVVTAILDFRFIPGLNIALATIALALAATIGLGLMTSWRILSKATGPMLREA